MDTLVLVGLGGAIGSVIRFELSKLQPVRGIPAGTALVNIIGSFAFSLVASGAPVSDLYSFIGIGLQ